MAKYQNYGFKVSKFVKTINTNNHVLFWLLSTYLLNIITRIFPYDNKTNEWYLLSIQSWRFPRQCRDDTWSIPLQTIRKPGPGSGSGRTGHCRCTGLFLEDWDRQDQRMIPSISRQIEKQGLMASWQLGAMLKRIY